MSGKSGKGGKGKKADRGEPGLSRDDALLWQAVAGSVRRLPGRKVVVPAETPRQPPGGPESPQAGGPGATGAGAPAGPATAAPAPRPPLAVGRFAGVDKRTADRLRKGRMPVDASLDLHGQYQDDARRLLTDFVLSQAARGSRCLLVVTGKGTRSAEGRGVLREAVPRWLNAPPLREHIVAISHAAQRDGGTGAYYLLLRRRREEDGR